MQSNVIMGGLPGPSSVEDREDWTTFWGYIATVEDAMLLIEATNRGICPRVTGRLHPRESVTIRSGAVFVFDEEESKMKRWTDKLLWSPSRQVGNFFVYRQMVTKIPRGTRVKEIEAMSLAAYGGVAVPVDPEVQAAERQYVGSLTSGPQYPRDGLVKKALAIGTMHVVSYFTLDDVMNGRLPTPSQSPELQGLAVSPRIEKMANASLPDPSTIHARYQAYPSDLAANIPPGLSYSPYRPPASRASTSPSLALLPPRSDSQRSHSVPTIIPRPPEVSYAQQDLPGYGHDSAYTSSSTTPSIPWGQLRLDIGTDQHTLPRRASDFAIGRSASHVAGSYESLTLQQVQMPVQQAATIPGFSTSTFHQPSPQQPSLPVRSAPLDMPNLPYRSSSALVIPFSSSAPTSFDYVGQQAQRMSSLGLASFGGQSPPSDISQEMYLQNSDRQRQQWVYAPTQHMLEWPNEQVSSVSSSPAYSYGQHQAPYYHRIQ